MLFTKEETARRLRISASTLDRLVKRQQLHPSVRIGPRRFFRPETLKHFIEQHSTGEEDNG